MQNLSELLQAVAKQPVHRATVSTDIELPNLEIQGHKVNGPTGSAVNSAGIKLPATGRPRLNTADMKEQKARLDQALRQLNDTQVAALCRAFPDLETSRTLDLESCHPAFVGRITEIALRQLRYQDGVKAE